MATSSRLCERQTLYSKHRETIMVELADWSAMYSLQAGPCLKLPLQPGGVIRVVGRADLLQICLLLSFYSHRSAPQLSSMTENTAGLEIYINAVQS